MKLIVGLGNPGQKYSMTRHNMGYRVLDLLADDFGVCFDREDFRASYTIIKFKGENIILFKPITFMNLSGEAVTLVMNYFHIGIKDLLVIYDDMALSPGVIRLKEKGSSGGQKGMQNIIDHLKTEEIKRIRIGIGEPTYDAIDYVLSRPSKEEEPLIEETLHRSVEAVKEFLKNGFLSATSRFSGGIKTDK